MNDADERIADLESHIAHQEATIRDLSDIVTKQWETVDELVAKVERLKDRLLALEEEVKSSPVKDDVPPPHY
ncbi:MAG: SlyX family protein [Rhodospirillaceae bacterium]|jgi:SlyX protein|nr:SlyX family protein [Rhodospirillales bacterium]MBT3906986.1 SlyX family protein [Rhodospirillaceae bacterium]MBT4701098.1 SlyX family protein [Rhodospirillaceae bacterium]MBT5033765.1 SlyX family protein [Rhodospirillaceae bacterium]MBT6219957.1 SlyX family protein [Rhodospirillaceae bacterium]